MATQVQNAIDRLKAVEAKQDKTLGEIAEAKRIQTEQTAEIARLREVIATLPESVPPETLAALEEVVSSIESKQTAIDEALPDLPVAGTSPDEGDGTSPTDGGDTGTEPTDDTGSGTEPAPAETVRGTPFR